MKKIISMAVLPFLLAACADNGTGKTVGYGSYAADGFTEESLGDVSYTPDALNTYLTAAAPKYYVGAAYKVEDIQYVPTEDLTYNQTGIAGIIPTEINGQLTSNGETFDITQMSATSKTLPLPTVARVTNLDNGSSVLVRVNNRGPFVNSRIMDLSPAAAQKLGIKGTAKVQVQVMAEQSIVAKNATLGTTTVIIEEPVETVIVTSNTGPYVVQAIALYSEENAQSMANRLSSYANFQVVHESGLYKVRAIGLDAATARRVIDNLRSSENMAPGLLKTDGTWVNADSI